MHLKHACLPISPPEQMNENEHSILFFAQSHKGVFSLFKKSAKIIDFIEKSHHLV